ncbi:hypothetical protein RF11_01905 [Thelohanellus kitauei]|uniref:Uncharacterized protein n=1 Tax=Thelohanellus kitauei TaxID=669202 RepID=A0A0C2IML6_THEKT|nr:hypothetical protein RF11_01905 [Thelohanellus kitauei]
MDYSLWRKLFIAFDVLAVWSCILLILGSIFPCLVIVFFHNPSPHDKALFGVLNWYYAGEFHHYEEVIFYMARTKRLRKTTITMLKMIKVDCVVAFRAHDQN